MPAFKNFASKPKSLKIAYTLMTFLGLQGVHQFYLGNWLRGSMIAVFIHIPMFYFAYLEGQSRASGVALHEDLDNLVPLLAITIGLSIGLGLFLWDMATLHKQARRANAV